MSTFAFATSIGEYGHFKEDEPRLYKGKLSRFSSKDSKRNSRDEFDYRHYCGFPGESEEDFEDTLDVVRKVKYDSAFTFIYSKRSGTPAAKWENQVSDEVIKERFDRLLKEVQKDAANSTKKYEKETVDILVENLNDHMDGYVTGRMSNNMVVHIPGQKSLIGKIVSVVLDEAKGFYYMGHMVESEV